MKFWNQVILLAVVAFSFGAFMIFNGAAFYLLETDHDISMICAIVAAIGGLAGCMGSLAIVELRRA